MKKEATKKQPTSSTHPKSADSEMEREEPEIVVICLRIIIGGAKVSADVAREKHDGRNGLCCMTCGNQCIRSRGTGAASKSNK